MNNLLTAYHLSGLELKNKIVMAPMTRSRAIKNIPNSLIAEYYAQRADAGLIITEGTSPSPNGLGYARIPGIFSQEQTEAWKKITAAVHNRDGKIFIQLMHTGRVTHSGNLPEGGIVVAPSAVKLDNTKMWVDSLGLVDASVPQEMTLEDIEDTIEEYAHASKNAILAGFDGVELHGANGYLIKQFLNPHTNRRTDQYGGNIENRSRFLIEVVKSVVAEIGKDKVGLRISPFGTFNEMPNYDEAEAQYLHIAKELNILGIAYLHLNDQSGKGEPNELFKSIRHEFGNTIILSGGYDAVKAEQVLKGNYADLISFARPFIANPDLVDRYKNNLPLNQPKFDLFYTPGREGYTDYPVFEDVQVLG
jgi:N-ethylmaleimide reductase